MKEFVTLRLEVESMRHTILRCLDERSLDLNAQVNSAVDKFLNSNELEKLVASSLNTVIAESIKSYFSYGDGHRIVKNLVEERLKSITESFEK